MKRVSVKKNESEKKLAVGDRSASPSVKPGRPRGFDPDEALEKAMKVFWSKGYEGASLPDLEKAMGINRPSMYAAFGNKQELFRKAMKRYTQGPAGFVRQALEKQTARMVVEHLLLQEVESITNPRNPGGCFAVQAALACGSDGDCVRNEMSAYRERGVTAVRKRFERAKKEGDLPKGSDPAALARYIATVMHGLAVQAAGGATREELKRVASMVLSTWPPRS